MNRKRTRRNTKTHEKTDGVDFLQVVCSSSPLDLQPRFRIQTNLNYSRGVEYFLLDLHPRFGVKVLEIRVALFCQATKALRRRWWLSSKSGRIIERTWTPTLSWGMHHVESKNDGGVGVCRSLRYRGQVFCVKLFQRWEDGEVREGGKVTFSFLSLNISMLSVFVVTFTFQLSS